MSIVKIRAALESQLLTITPVIPTVFENMPYTPVNGAPYQRADLLPAETQSPSFGDNFRRETGIFQVMLCYPTVNASDLYQGSGDANARAELIRASFVRRTSLVFGGVYVIIERHPSVGAAIIAGDRFCLPVRIRYFANIQV